MFDKNTYFIREHVGLLKLTDTYDILDPETQEQIAVAKEKVGGLMILLRLMMNKQMLPTKVNIYQGNDPKNERALIFSIKRGFTLFRSRVEVITADGQLLGWFKSKIWSIGGSFRVFDAGGNEVALVKGDWKGWNFKFLDNQKNEIGTVTKKWAGLGKELFTSADNYVISVNGNPDPTRMMLLLAAGLAIDIVYKESKS